MGHRRAAAGKETSGVDGEHPVPVLLGEVGEELLLGDAGVIYKEVQLAPPLQNGLDQGLHLRRRGHIPLEGEDLAALRRQGGAEGVGPFQALIAAHRHPPAIPGQEGNSSSPDTPAPAGDDGSSECSTHKKLSYPYKMYLI